MIRLTTAQHKSDTTVSPNQDWFVEPTAITQLLPFWSDGEAANYPKGRAFVVVAPDTEARAVEETMGQILELKSAWAVRHQSYGAGKDGLSVWLGDAHYLQIDEDGDVAGAHF